MLQTTRFSNVRQLRAKSTVLLCLSQSDVASTRVFPFFREKFARQSSKLELESRRDSRLDNRYVRAIKIYPRRFCSSKGIESQSRSPRRDPRYDSRKDSSELFSPEHLEENANFPDCGINGCAVLDSFCFADAFVLGSFLGRFVTRCVM